MTEQQWFEALRQLEEVVCVTALENQRLEQIESTGVVGPNKYEMAKIKFVDINGKSCEPWK
jgi:hypothetical protein